MSDSEATIRYYMSAKQTWIEHGIPGLLAALADARHQEEHLRGVLREVDRKTRNNCPLCGSGVNKWGHTLDCPLWQALPEVDNER